MFLHLLVLSIAVFLRPNDEEPLLKKLDETEGHDIVNQTFISVEILLKINKMAFFSKVSVLRRNRDVFRVRRIRFLPTSRGDHGARASGLPFKLGKELLKIFSDIVADMV